MEDLLSVIRLVAWTLVAVYAIKNRFIFLWVVSVMFVVVVTLTLNGLKTPGLIQEQVRTGATIVLAVYLTRKNHK